MKRNQEWQKGVTCIVYITHQSISTTVFIGNHKYQKESQHIFIPVIFSIAASAYYFIIKSSVTSLKKKFIAYL